MHGHDAEKDSSECSHSLNNAGTCDLAPRTTPNHTHRLVRHSAILELNIANYRLEAAKQAKLPEAASGREGAVQQREAWGG